jgi:hypothetical protein
MARRRSRGAYRDDLTLGACRGATTDRLAPGGIKRYGVNWMPHLLGQFPYLEAVLPVLLLRNVAGAHHHGVEPQAAVHLLHCRRHRRRLGRLGALRRAFARHLCYSSVWLVVGCRYRTTCQSNAEVDRFTFFQKPKTKKTMGSERGL